jgi:phage head maturation protease
MEIKANGIGNLVFKISTKSTDRDEDVMEPMGCDLTNYRNNPVVLFAHDYSSLPVGKSLRESIYPEYIESEVEFAPTGFAQDCRKLCEGGFLKAASVGFNGVEFDQIPESRWGKHYTKWELLEWSIVPVPANPTCLIQTAKAKGLNLDAMEKELHEIESKEPGWRETGESFRYRVRDPWKFEQDSFRTIPIQKEKPKVNAVVGILKDGGDAMKIHTIIFPKEEGWEMESAQAWLGNHDDLTKEIFDITTKSVVPYKKYPLADESETWDGPAEIAAASVDDLKIMCTWYDSENADAKQAYKLPHHKQDGYATVWRAVAAAMGALLGARGGVSIPDAERKGVYNHLAKHYKDFDKEPPEFKEYTADELKSAFPTFELDECKEWLRINGESESKAITYDLLKALDKKSMKDYTEWKSGATISAKNRTMLNEICENMKDCGDRLRKFIDDTSGMMEDETESPPKRESTELIEIKEALAEIKSQVLSLCEKSAVKDADKIEFDLAAIEFVKSSKPLDELDITPDELRKMIDDKLNIYFKGEN